MSNIKPFPGRPKARSGAATPTVVTVGVKPKVATFKSGVKMACPQCECFGCQHCDEGWIRVSWDEFRRLSQNNNLTVED